MTEIARLDAHRMFTSILQTKPVDRASIHQSAFSMEENYAFAIVWSGRAYFGCVHAAFATSFTQTNLVSDISGLALNTDPNMKDPWGMSFSNTSPIWVSDRATGVATLYSGTGTIESLVVATPPGAPNVATGQVNASGLGFMVNGSAASFIFDTLGGTIDAWGGGTTATVESATAGANFTGLALAHDLPEILYQSDREYIPTIKCPFVSFGISLRLPMRTSWAGCGRSQGRAQAKFIGEP